MGAKREDTEQHTRLLRRAKAGWLGVYQGFFHLMRSVPKH